MQIELRGGNVKLSGARYEHPLERLVGKAFPLREALSDFGVFE